MPWTFSHPAAVLPLKRLCPRYLHFPALLIGSLTPDLGYYVGRFDVAQIAHTAQGGVLVCLPAGLVLLLLLAKLREPLLFLLPRLHRDALSSLFPAADRPGLRSVGAISCSVVLGAWTHVLWDAFTHAGRWGQVHLPWLGDSAWTMGGEAVPVYALLQHASTALGAFALGVGYRRVLRKCETGRPADHHDDLGDRHRINLILALLFAAASVAVVGAGIAADGAAEWRAVRIFVFAAAIYGTTAFALLYAVAAVMIYGQLQRRASHT